MAAIDIGPGAVDVASSNVATYTIIEYTNPANASGTITSFELWFLTDATGVKAGTFSYDGGAEFTNRDGETIGNVTSGSKQTFSGLDCDVESGDYAGYYFETGTIEAYASTNKASYKSGDQFGAGQQTYTLNFDAIGSIYGTGGMAVVSLSGTLTTSGTLASTYRQVKSLAGTLNLSGTLSTAFRYTKSLAGTLTSSGTLIGNYPFRYITVKVITSQYRCIKILTGQYRCIKILTGQYRKIKSLFPK